MKISFDVEVYTKQGVPYEHTIKCKVTLEGDDTLVDRIRRMITRSMLRESDKYGAIVR